MKIIAASNYVSYISARRHPASTGFAHKYQDFIFLDAEHTPMGPEFMKEMIQTGNYYVRLFLSSCLLGVNISSSV